MFNLLRNISICHCEDCRKSNDFLLGRSNPHCTRTMKRKYYIYIVTNKYNTVLYTGVTNNLKRRVYEHREKRIEGFTRKYDVSKLVYYEIYNNVIDAIKREKQIKSGSRRKKNELIIRFNKNWKDLYYEL